ncbi:helix-turn-helix domain-containing protein [Macrococcus animalis]|uniref:helix-turn-helix domain-containing protein n=1 Tax=Macrococcus animalis TaxID=3395467 RepID=UPI0039BEAB43
MKNKFSAILGEKRLKVSDVYEATKISRTTLHALYHERTENPDTKTIMKICDFLDITPNDFFGIKEAN